MKSLIPIKDKKIFLNWFLKYYMLKNHKSRWLLEYLLTDDELLKNVHFIHNAKYCPRSIILKVENMNKISFYFHKKHVVTTEVEKSFHDLRFKKDEPIFIQINFNHSNKNPYYLAVLEENPYDPEVIETKKKDEQFAKDILEHSIQKQRIHQLKKEIDLALDENNRNKFNQLVIELKKLTKNFKKG